MRLEEAGKFVEYFYRKEMRHRRFCKLFHRNWQPPPDFFRQDYQHRACQCGKSRSIWLFAVPGGVTFQIASCGSMQRSLKCNDATCALSRG